MVVIVVGMHRSGTSALAGMLHTNGISMGDEGDFHPPPKRENPKGFYENGQFRAVNDEVLRTAGYDVKTFDPNLPDWQRPADERAWRQMLHLVDGYQGRNKHWGWKDPRTCLTLWHWLKALRDRNATTQVLVTYRAFEEIAKSMRKRGNRENLYPGQFTALAENYYGHLTHALIKAEQHFLRVDFENLIFDTQKTVTAIEEYLQYGLPDISFIDPDVSRTA